MAGNDFLIKVDNLTKNRGKRRILKNISFTISKGERIALIGSNGAGKTTLCEIISGFKKGTSGKVIYGFPDNQLSKKIAINFQHQSFPEELNVYDIVTYYRRLYPKVKESQFKHFLEVFEINGLKYQRLTKLSIGQLQRVNLFLTLFYKPLLFIGDEITTGLDIEKKTSIIEFIKENIVSEKMSILLVSHNWEEISYLCERVIFLQEGVIIDDLSVKTIIDKYGSFIDYFNYRNALRKN
jgi:ABC-2 type transport system ATP-binding protein